MDRRRDGAARRHWTHLDVKSCHRKMSHVPTIPHRRRRVDDKLPERSGTWWRAWSWFPTGFPPMCRSASCTSESEVSDQKRAGQKSHRRRRRRGDPMAEGSERRIK